MHGRTKFCIQKIEIDILCRSGTGLSVSEGGQSRLVLSQLYISHMCTININTTVLELKVSNKDTRYNCSTINVLEN